MTSRCRTVLPWSLAAVVAPAVLLAACGDEIHYNFNYYQNEAGGGGEAPAPAEGGASPGGSGAAGAPAGEAGVGGGDDGRDPRYPDAPLADTAVADLELDLFGKPGNHFYFAVSDEQRLAMNQRRDQGGGGPWGPHYVPGDGSRATYVDHLLVTTAGRPYTADYGKVQVNVVGSSTFQEWDALHIPNLNIDIDQFVEDQRIAGFEHLRFSNGQVGSIFRDRLAYDIYRALGYPAPRVTYAWVASNVWGPTISIPYILVERYKQAFCDHHAAEFGGGCVNMWEFMGDFGGGLGGPKQQDVGMVPGGGGSALWDDPANCQIESCEGSRAVQFEQLLAVTPPSEGFKAATQDYVDWPAYHRFQCLSWILATSDDPVHVNNNVVLVEGNDGLFRYLPYSVDISLGFGDSGVVGLRGNNVLSRGCQDDPVCWQDTLDVCESLAEELMAADPREMLLDVRDELETEGMLRRGDEYHYQRIDDYLAQRMATLPAALQAYRDGALCEAPQVECNGSCQDPPCFGGGEPKPEPEPEPAIYGVE